MKSSCTIKYNKEKSKLSKIVFKSNQKYPKVPKNTQTYSKVPKSTNKFQKIPKKTKSIPKSILPVSQKYLKKIQNELKKVIKTVS